MGVLYAVATGIRSISDALSGPDGSDIIQIAAMLAIATILFFNIRRLETKKSAKEIRSNGDSIKSGR